MHSHVAGTLSLAIDLHDAARHIDGELKRMMTEFAQTEDEHFLKFHEGLGEDTEHLFVDLGGVSFIASDGLNVNPSMVSGSSICPLGIA